MTPEERAQELGLRITQKIIDLINEFPQVGELAVLWMGLGQCIAAQDHEKVSDFMANIVENEIFNATGDEGHPDLTLVLGLLFEKMARRIEARELIDTMQDESARTTDLLKTYGWTGTALAEG